MDEFRQNHDKNRFSGRVFYRINSDLLGRCQQYYDAVFAWVSGTASTNDIHMLATVSTYPLAVGSCRFLSVENHRGWGIIAGWVVVSFDRNRSPEIEYHYIDGLIGRFQRKWRARRKLYQAAEWLSRPDSDYQQLVNCGEPARKGWYGIRVVIQIPDEPIKHEWKQLDSLLASGYSLAQTFGKQPTPVVAVGSTAAGAKRKRTRKQTRPTRLPQ